MKYAFRCKTCGQLDGPDHAGEAVQPFQCRVCKAGVVHSPSVAAFAAELAKADCTTARRLAIAEELASGKHSNERPKIIPENWEVLADCSTERLKELDLAPSYVVRHVPYTKKVVAPAPGNKDVAVHSVDTPKTADKA